MSIRHPDKMLISGLKIEGIRMIDSIWSHFL